MADTATPAGWDGNNNAAPGKTIPWRLLFRIVRWVAGSPLLTACATSSNFCSTRAAACGLVSITGGRAV